MKGRNILISELQGLNLIFGLLREAEGEEEETYPKVCKILRPERKGFIINKTQEDKSKATSREKNLSPNRFTWVAGSQSPKNLPAPDEPDYLSVWGRSMGNSAV